MFNKCGWLLLVPIILTFKGKVISPNLEVINVIWSYFEDFSSIIPDSGETVYLASTFDSYDWGIMLNFALISEWLFNIIDFVYG